MFLGGLARASWHKQRSAGAGGIMFPSDIAPPSQSICYYSGRTRGGGGAR